VVRVACADVHVNAGERGDAASELTDVYVEELFADELVHETMLALACGLHRFVRVLHQPLCAGEGAWHVETAVEIAEILGRLKRLLERRFREAQRRAQPLELAGIDVCHTGIMTP
jgi:hypothetical protein